MWSRLHATHYGNNRLVRVSHSLSMTILGVWGLARHPSDRNQSRACHAMIRIRPLKSGVLRRIIHSECHIEARSSIPVAFLSPSFARNRRSRLGRHSI